MQLVAQRGEPMSATSNHDAALWAYFSPGGGSLELVMIRKEYVAAVVVAGRKLGPPALPEDISGAGVHLGGPFPDTPASQQQATIVDGDVTYSFKPSEDRQTVYNIMAILKKDVVDHLPPVAQTPTLHSGDSMADAVVLHAPNETLGEIFEGGFLAGHDFCHPGKWKKLGTDVSQANGRLYHLFKAGCDNSDKTKTIYFDITGYGKP